MSDFGSDCGPENHEKNVPDVNNCAITVFEDPVVKIFRGFQNVPEKAIKLMKYVKRIFSMCTFIRCNCIEPKYLFRLQRHGNHIQRPIGTER